MKLPRDLSGAELARHLCQTTEPQPHRLAVPNHAAVRIGTLNAILRAVQRPMESTKRMF